VTYPIQPDIPGRRLHRADNRRREWLSVAMPTLVLGPEAASETLEVVTGKVPSRSEDKDT
jgi:hypothetical protein